MYKAGKRERACLCHRVGLWAWLFTAWLTVPAGVAGQTASGSEAATPEIATTSFALAGFATSATDSAGVATSTAVETAGTARAMRVSLLECVRQSVDDNLGIARNELERESESFSVETAQKIFIPEVSLQVRDVVDRSKTAGVDQVVSKTFRDGMKGGFRSSTSDDWNLSEHRSRSHSVFLTRPLLRNFGRRIAGHSLDLSRIDYEIAIEKFKSDLNEFIYRTAALYLDLAFARRNLEITEQACQRARQQYEDTRHDIELGAIAAQEIYVVEENLLQFEMSRENARHDIRRLELSLKRAMGIDAAAETVVPTALDLDPPGFLASDTFSCPASFPVAVAEMFANNPDFRMKELAVRRSQSDLLYQRNQARPQLDLSTEYRWREGREFGQRDYFSAGLLYDVPLSHRAERAAVEKSRVGLRIQELTVEDARAAMTYELRTIQLEIAHLEEIHKSRIRAVELARKKLDAEVEKYKNGFTTLADIVRFQRDLEEAMLGELRAVVQVNKQRLNLCLVGGTLYRNFSIAIGN